jgi:hypothetical protein
MGRNGMRTLLFDNVDIASGKDTLQAGSFISTSPPCRNLLLAMLTKRYSSPPTGASHHSTQVDIQSLFICSVTCTRSFCCKARSPASVGVYAYRALASDSTCGPDAYAGGGGAGAGVGL